MFDKRCLYADGVPKGKVFEPELHPTLRRWETSVCGRLGVTDERMWTLGKTIRPGKTCIAAVEIQVSRVVEAELHCEAAPEDYPEHGVILGWAANDKDARLAQQQDLAEAHSRVLRPA